MNLDVQTLFYATGLVVVASGVSFVVTTIMRLEDGASRLWSLGFIAGMLGSLSYSVWGFSPGLWWVVGAGNGALALSLGAMWAGCRAYNGRRTLVAVPLVVAVGVSVAVFLQGREGGAWAGSAEMFVAIAAFAALAGIETLRGALRHSVNARVLGVVFGGVAVYYVLRTVALFGWGASSPEFLDGFGIETTCLVYLVFITMAATSLSVLQSERVLVNRLAGAVIGREAIPGLTSRAAFLQQADQWLDRADREWEELVLVLVDVENLDHMNIALGRDYGDRAIQSVAKATRENVPLASLVGALSSHRLAILTAAPPVGDLRSVGERVLTALAETPVDEAIGVRAAAVFGVASTSDFGFDFADLERAAESAIGHPSVG